ncbi:MAG: hypothetical protein J0M28_03950 [Thauera sp.]|nr:hypothetical protein [Thauera sp.]
MHSGFLLLLWLTGLGTLQSLPAATLPWAAAAIAAAAMILARGRFLALLRRIRVLLAAILVLFGWLTPGESVLTQWPELGPSREGLVLASEHALRLIAVIASVAIVLERLSVDRLVSGLHAICRPAAWIGLPSEKLALRLLLVLRHVEAVEGAKARGWRAWLLEDDDSPVVAVVRLERESLGPAECLVGAAVVLSLAVWGLA